MLKIIASKDLIDHVIQAIHITDEKIEPQRRPVFLEAILRLITVMGLNWGLCPALFLSGTKKYLSVKWRLTFLALSWILFFFFFLSFWGLGIFTGRTEYSVKDWIIHWWCWNWSSNTLATWCEEPTHWKRPWWWERLKAGGEAKGWDGWMASPTQWTRV